MSAGAVFGAGDSATVALVPAVLVLEELVSGVVGAGSASSATVVVVASETVEAGAVESTVSDGAAKVPAGNASDATMAISTANTATRCALCRWLFRRASNMLDICSLSVQTTRERAR